MKLDGMIYKRTGGFSPADSNSSTGSGNNTSSSEKVVAPSDADAQALMKKTISALADLIESDDFTATREHAPKELQDDNFEDKVRAGLKEFINDKRRASILFRSAEKTNMTFSPPPAVTEEQGRSFLTVNGLIPSQPLAGRVANKYVYQDGQCKLVSFKYSFQ